MGLGYPAGYPGSGPERPTNRTVRDERLLAYTQLAALDGAGVAVQLSFPPLRTCADHVTLIAMPIILLCCEVADADQRLPLRI